MPSGPCGPRCNPRRRARSRSLKRPSGLRWSAIRRPSLATTPASSLAACRTSARSASATSRGDTQVGSTSRAAHTVLMWSSPTAPAATAAANSGSSGGTGGPVSERRGRIRAASRKRRVISLGVMRSRAHSVSRTAGTNPPPSGGSAISAKNRYINPRLVRSCVSSRSATPRRKSLPTTSEEVSRSTSWAASIASRAAAICSRACSALIRRPTPSRYRTHIRTSSVESRFVDELRTVDNPRPDVPG